MHKVIPPNAAAVSANGDGGSEDGHSAKREQLELELLTLEAQIKGFAKKEVGQRYWVKWIAVGSGVVVVGTMISILTHLFHHMFWGPFFRGGAALSVAMIVAPITSITVITGALFVAAFRKFEDKDVDTIGSSLKAGSDIFKP